MITLKELRVHHWNAAQRASDIAATCSHDTLNGRSMYKIYSRRADWHIDAVLVLNGYLPGTAEQDALGALREKLHK